MSETVVNYSASAYSNADKKPARQPRIRAYREFLTPLLHRRFVSAASLATAICYAEALVLSYQSSPVTWLPFAALIRASLIFVTALIIFLLRISQLRFSPRTSVSSFRTILSSLAEGATYQTIAFYAFAAWVFSEVHIHSAPYEADLGWVANGELYERLRLNEKVIYLRSHAFIIAAMQSTLHLRNDYSCVRLPVADIDKEEHGIQDESKSVRDRLQLILPTLFGQIIKRSMVLAIVSPFVYIFVRPWAWKWSLSFARLVWNIPENSQPGIIPPFHWSVLLRTLLQGVLLFSLSEGCNTLFSLFVTQEPTKLGKPLTSGSKDPNGSLVNGLRAKKPAVRSYALWELNVIVNRFPDRRRSILTELDRQGQSAWVQLLKVCLDIIENTTARVEGTSKPNQSVPAGQESQIATLPRIVSPMRTDPVAPAFNLSSSSESFSSFVDRRVRKVGAAPPSAQLNLSPKVKRYMEDARDRFLTKQQQQALSIEQLEATAQGIMGKLLRFKIPASPFTEEFQPGVIFQQTFSRRINLTVFGTPFSERTDVIRAADILSALLVASITEDSYGVVSKDIPAIWRAFVKAIDGLEGLLRTTTVHWTDLNFSDDKKNDKEVEELLRHLQNGLAKLVEHFSNDSSARGLTPADVKNARRAAGLYLRI